MPSLKTLSSKIPFALGFMIAFWLLLGLVDLLKNYVEITSYGRDFDWLFSTKFVITYSTAWILLSLPIYKTFRLVNRRSWPQKLALHLFLSLLFGCLHSMIVSLFFSFVVYDSGINTQPFWEFYAGRISQRILPSTVNSALAYWVVIIILFAFDYYQKYQKQALVALQLESQLTRAKLQTLKMQLQPHFLFNAHNTISMLVRTKKFEQAVNMISGLSDLLRTSLTRADTQLIPLHEELDLLKKYLAIEQARFEDRLSVHFEIDAGVVNAIVPNLILQPIVENAFKHGISRQLENAEIEIAVYREQQQLIMRVYNSGPPLAKENPRQNNTGIGLANTRNRLKQLYQDNFLLSIQNRKDGVEVEIKIPFKEQKETIDEPV